MQVQMLKQVTKNVLVVLFLEEKMYNRKSDFLRSYMRIKKPLMGFKNFVCAAALLAGIEISHMIKKGKSLFCKTLSPWRQFYALAG